MKTPKRQYTTVVDSKSFRPISGVNRTRRDENESGSHDMTPEELEHRKEEIAYQSPEGTPSDPGFTSGGMVLMILGTFGVVLLFSVVVLAVWGFAAGALVLVFGAALACLGNPVIWSTLLRAEERHEIEEHHRDDHTR